MSRTALVTGGASGIGRAIAAAIVGQGGRVVLADIDGRVEQTATQLSPDGGQASAATLDVRDADAVADLYTRTDRDLDGIDLVVNNAGVAVGGAVDELDLEHWNRAIDVNLRGVVNGVHAAYPLMVARGRGHILNTASLAGLTTPPLMAPYVATKHAVVGLSLSMRPEAAAKGVRVSVLCPGFVDTPLLDQCNSGLRPTLASQRTREIATLVSRRLYDADALAADVMTGLARNRAVIVAPATARLAWAASRFSPRLAMWAAGRGVRRYARELQTAAGVARSA